jgi:putative ABC transport system substrate-binding protein
MKCFAGCIAVAVSLLAASPGPAQTRVPRIGVLSPLDPGVTWFSEGLRAGLAEHGYVEGRTIEIEFRWAHGRFERLPELAAELVNLHVDVIVAGVTQASLAAKQATRSIPVVMVGVGDPVAVGLVDSLARPGGNVTGTSTIAIDIVAKQVELVKELAPQVSRVGVLWNPDNHAFQSLQVRQAENAARAAGLELRFVEARGPDDFMKAVSILRRENFEAALVLGDPIFTMHRQALAARLAEGRLIAVSGVREFAEAGGLVAYGASYSYTSRRAALFVERILKGAKPAELAVEQSDRFELVVNMRAARRMGIEIPPSILARADEVIE